MYAGQKLGIWHLDIQWYYKRIGTKLDQRLAMLQDSHHLSASCNHMHKYLGWKLVYQPCRNPSSSSICIHKFLSRKLAKLKCSLLVLCRRCNYKKLDQISVKRGSCKSHCSTSRCMSTSCYRNGDRLDQYNSLRFFYMCNYICSHRSPGILHQCSWLTFCHSSMSKYCY